MNAEEHNDDAGLEPVVVKIDANTRMTACLDRAARLVRVELPAHPRRIVLAADAPGTEELIAELITTLRELRADQRSDRSRTALGAQLAGASAAEETT